MAGKYGRTTIEKLREETIDISERKKFKFYNLCWYWDTQNNNTESRIGRWLGDSNRVGSALCYWFLSEKWNIISHTNVQHATQDEAENLEIQQSIWNYHMELEYAIGIYEFMLDIDGMDAFINKEVTSQEEEYVWEKPYQGLPDSPDIDNVLDK